MLRLFFLLYATLSYVGVNSQGEEIMAAKAVFETIKDTAKLANDIAIKIQPGNGCFKNEDCFPINIFDNLCCIKNGFIGQCCNMFTYIAERPTQNAPKFFEDLRKVNALIALVVILLIAIVSLISMLLFIKFCLWICCSCCTCHKKRVLNYFLMQETLDTNQLIPNEQPTVKV